ncbi:MAG TPA: zinc-dependent alcohol dehydrogenase family protein [Steroidobacteraceae bacterium]|nr:zinc-dependent alcohol dehydrogenase family protein [Steroidobacteraceae bacterium]
MVLRQPGSALVAEQRTLPVPGPGQVRVRISACAVCRTDLHVVDGELPDPKLPIVPGHEIVGVIDAVGNGSARRPGERVGIPWLGYTCGRCDYCRSGQENLCDSARFTGYQIDGGYAGYTLADERFCLALPPGLDDLHTAPLLCAGLIGYRCLVKAGDAQRIGLYGFGAAAHLIAQIARHQRREIYAFVRRADDRAAAFARSLGAVWAGASDEAPPQLLDAAIIFAPAGELVPLALRAVRKGGRVVCGGIHMSPIPSFPYDWLWGERQIVSVANLTRADGVEFLRLAERMPLEVQVHRYALERAQQALDDLRAGRFSGVAVLVPGSDDATA